MGKNGPFPYPLDRIWERYSVAPTGCWEWQGNKDRTGRGKIGLPGGRTALVSRIAWELSFGPIPDGLNVLHHCDNPSCINPGHLFLGTQIDNIRDMVSKRRQRPTMANLKPGAGIGVAVRDQETGRWAATVKG